VRVRLRAVAVLAVLAVDTVAGTVCRTHDCDEGTGLVFLIMFWYFGIPLCLFRFLFFAGF
jgi:hypothetical protein